MDKQISKLEELVHNDNVDLAINLGRFKNKEYVETAKWTYDDEYFKLTPESDFKAFEKRYEKNNIHNINTRSACAWCGILRLIL